MSSVIRFLESMGQNAELRYSSRSSLYQSLNAQQIDPETQWAILRGDVERLSSMLGINKEMVCAIRPPYDPVVEEAVQNVEQAIAA